MALIKAENVVKDYKVGEVLVRAINGVSFEIEEASFVSFVGPSGSGKTTLLNLIGCLDSPTEGNLFVDGENVNGLDRRQGALFRGKNIGFIFQDFNLIPVLTVYENIEYPLIMVQNVPTREREERIMKLLDAVGMLEQKNKYPDQISGGQKQRLSIARALAKRPDIYIFDDSFSALDFKTDAALRKALKKETGDSTVMIVGQRISTIMHADRIVVIHKGKVVGIGRHQSLMRECEVYRELALSQLSKEELQV